MTSLALGITGHRFLDEIEKIHRAIDCAVERLLASFPAARFRLLSSLAEGADQLVTEKLLQLPGASLQVVLPLPPQEYVRTFKSSASIGSFERLLAKADRVRHPPASGSPQEAYAAAGEFIVANSDILLAVWDGNPAQGRGGTGDLITLARQRSLPLIWIHAGNRQPGSQIPTSLGDGQGIVTVENFPLQGQHT